MTLRALLVGINYTTKPHLRLSGCINDVLAAKEYLLEKHAAKSENIKVMVDDYNQATSPSLWPTQRNLFEQISSSLKCCQPGDVFLFHFSGLGSTVFENDGTSHEALVPLDVRDLGNKFENLIHDYELERLILDNTPARVTIYVILDCCYNGGDTEKQGPRRRVLLPHRVTGSRTRVAFPRGIAKNLDAIPSTASTRSMVAMLRDITDKKKGDVSIVLYTAGAKNEPVADATFNYKCFGAFSYFLYNTLQLNKPLQNIKIIDTVKDSIKRSNFNQCPQLVVSKPEQSKWSFLTHQEGDANATVVMLRELVAITGAIDLRELSDKDIEEMHILDSAATLEVSRAVAWYSKVKGVRVPFVARDIARVFTGLAGRTVFKIAQSQGLDENLAFSAASFAIRESTHLIFEHLLPAPVNAKRCSVKQPDLFYLMENVVTTSIDKVLKEHLPEAKKELVERATANTTAVSLLNISAVLAQPADLSMQLADLCSQIAPKSTHSLRPTNKLIAHSIELVKQIVASIIASDVYRQDINKKLPNISDMAKEIAARIDAKYTDTFIAQLTSSLNLQAEVEKLAIGVIRDISKDRVAVVDQDIEDRVAEVTTRFSNFIGLTAPTGQILFGTLTSNNAPMATVESFVGSLCKIAVDDIAASLPGNSNWSMVKMFQSSSVPVLFKVAAKSIAEVAVLSILSMLKYYNAALSTGTLIGIVNVVAKNSTTKVFELLGSFVETSSSYGAKLNGLGKGNSSLTLYNAFYGLTHIAVQASSAAVNTIASSPESRIAGELDYATQQVLSNVSRSSTRLVSLLPILGMAIPLVQAGLGGCKNVSSNVDALYFGTEILATTIASLTRQGSISYLLAEEIVKEATYMLSSYKYDANSIVDAVTASIQRAFDQRSNLKDVYNPTILRREVLTVAKHFEPFYPVTSFAALSTLPGIDVRAVLEGTSLSATQQLNSFIPEGYAAQKAGPAFILNIGKASATVAATALIGVLQSRGVLNKNTDIQDRIKRLAISVAKKVVSELLTGQTSCSSSMSSSSTVLEWVTLTIVMEVAKEVDSITGTNTTTTIETAHIVANCAHCFGAMLPILSSVTPSLIQAMLRMIPSFSDNAGLDIRKQVILLAIVDVISENFMMLKSKAGGLITSDNIVELLTQALQSARDNQTSVEQVIRNALLSTGIKGEISDFNIRSVITRTTRIMQENIEPPTSRSIPDDLQYAMVEPLATLLVQQRTFGSYLPLAAQTFGRTAGTIAGKAAVGLNKALLQNRTIAPEVANMITTTAIQNATSASINMFSSGKASHDGFTFEQIVLDVCRTAIEKALEQHLGGNKSSVDVTAEVSSVCGGAEFSRKIGTLGFEKALLKDYSASVTNTAPLASMDQATSNLVREACYFIIASHLRADVTKTQAIFNEVISELNKSDITSQLSVAPKPLEIVEQLVVPQLTQSLKRNGIIANDLGSQVRLVLEEFHVMAPITPMAPKPRGGIFDTVSPTVSSLATGAIHEITQATANTLGITKVAERVISPFVLILAKSIAEISANAVLEVTCKMNTNISSIALSSVLTSVAKKAAQKVFALFGSTNAPTSGQTSGNLLVVVLPFIVDIVIQGVSDLTLSREPITAMRVNVLEVVKSSLSRTLNPLLITVNDQMLGVLRTTRFFSETNEVTSIGSDAVAAIAYNIAMQDAVDGRSAEKLATDAAVAFHKNTTRIPVREWSTQRLENEVTRAIFQTVTSSGTSKRNETDIKAVVCSAMPQFVPFLPPTIPVCGTQSSKDELLAKVDQQVSAVLTNQVKSEFIRAVARAAAQVAAGATIDSMAALYRATPISLESTLKSAVDVGIKTANTVLSSFGNLQAGRSNDNVVLTDVLAYCRPMIQESLMTVSGQTKMRELDVQTVAANCLANNTRFFGSLLPILSTVAPSLITTIGSLISGSKSTGVSYRASEAAAITTVTLLIEAKGRDITGNMIEGSVRGCVDRLAGCNRGTGSGDLSLEDVQRAVEETLQSANVFQTVPKFDIESRLRGVGGYLCIPWGKSTPWNTTSMGTLKLPQSVQYSDQVHKIATQVLQIYNGSATYREEISTPAVLHAIDAVLTFPRLNGFPDSFICEVAKTAGCITAKEMMHQNPDGSRAVTLGLAVVAQLLTPSDLPRNVCVPPQAH